MRSRPPRERVFIGGVSKESCIDFGLVKIAAASPALRLANVPANVCEIGAMMNRAAAQHAAIVAFPELSLTGYSCGDLFFQAELLRESEQGLRALAKITAAADITAIVANSLGILNELAAPRSYYVVPVSPRVTAPVYVQPVPVCPAPVYRRAAPPPRRWYYAPPRRPMPRCPR